MKKKKFYLGRRHLKPFHWFKPVYASKVPRMLREYYGLLMLLSRIEQYEKLRMNGVIGMSERTDNMADVDTYIRESLARRKAIKQAILTYAPLHVLRGFLSNE